MQDLRRLVIGGVVLVLAGWVVGWFERFLPAVGAEAFAVRPYDLLISHFAWVLLLPLLVAPFVPFDRRRLRVASFAVVPFLVWTFVAEVLRPRDVVPGVPIGEVVRDRTLGQALSLVGALVVAMALFTAWRRGPDWREPAQWHLFREEV